MNFHVIFVVVVVGFFDFFNIYIYLFCKYIYIYIYTYILVILFGCVLFCSSHHLLSILQVKSKITTKNFFFTFSQF